MKKMKYNSIPKQKKSGVSRITPEEWNFIINVLKEQTNFNTETIEDLITSSNMSQEELLEKIILIESGARELASLVEELKETKEIYIGSDEPTGKETIWFDTSNK